MALPKGGLSGMKRGSLLLGDAPAPAPAAEPKELSAAAPKKAISVLEGSQAVKSLMSTVAPKAPLRTAPPMAAAQVNLYKLEAVEVDQLLATARSIVEAAGHALAPFWQAQTQMNLPGTHLSGRAMQQPTATFFRATATLLGKVSVFVHALEAARGTGLGAVVSAADVSAVEELYKNTEKAPELYNAIA